MQLHHTKQNNVSFTQFAQSTNPESSRNTAVLAGILGHCPQFTTARSLAARALMTWTNLTFAAEARCNNDRTVHALQCLMILGESWRWLRLPVDSNKSELTFFCHVP